MPLNQRPESWFLTLFVVTKLVRNSRLLKNKNKYFTSQGLLRFENLILIEFSWMAVNSLKYSREAALCLSRWFFFFFISHNPTCNCKSESWHWRWKKKKKKLYKVGILGDGAVFQATLIRKHSFYHLIHGVLWNISLHSYIFSFMYKGHLLFLLLRKPTEACF